MTVFLAIATVVAIALMGLISARLTSIEKHEIQNAGIASAYNALKKFTDECNKTANGNFTAIAERFDKENDRIEDIISQLEAITADIKRLDEEVTKVKKDELEIRKYYINFATPTALPVYEAGVPWAKDFKCVDDFTDEDKIHILEEEANAYRWQLNNEKMSPDDKLVTLNAYGKCLHELKGYTDKENNNDRRTEEIHS